MVKSECGAQYISYWSRDLLKERRIAAKDINYAPYSHIIAKKYSLSRILTSEEYQLVQKYVDDKGRTFNDLKNNLYARTRLVEKALSMPSSTIRMGKIVTPGGKKREYRIFEQNHTAEWKVDENNRFIRKNNPFYNGEIDLNEEAIDPVTGLIAKK